MSQDLYARRLNATTAFIRAVEDITEPTYREKREMEMAREKEKRDAELDMFIRKNEIAEESAIRSLRKKTEIEFENFMKMEDEKYRRQVEAYKDGELLTLQLQHETAVAQWTHQVATQLEEEEKDKAAISRVVDTPEIEALQLPSGLEGRPTWTSFDPEGIDQKRIGFGWLGGAGTMSATEVLDYGNQYITGVSSQVADLKAAADKGVNLTNNYLYKQTLDKVQTSLLQMQRRGIEKRFIRWKSGEKRKEYYNQIAQLKSIENSLLNMVK